MARKNETGVHIDDVMTSALPDFSDGELDDIAQSPAAHSKRVRIEARKELHRRQAGGQLDSDSAWKLIQAEKSGYAQRAGARAEHRNMLLSEAGELARRIREQWVIALTSEDWKSAVHAYEAVLHDRVRESVVRVGLGERKKPLQHDVTPARAESELRMLREQKIAEADALAERQRQWATAENKREEGNRHPRRRPAYMNDNVRRPPEPPNQ